MNDENVRAGRKQRDGLEILERIVRKLFVQTWIDCELRRQREHNRITVRRRFRNDFHSDISARAATVVEDDLLLQIFPEAVSQRASDRVCAAARRVRNDEPYRLCPE